MILRTAFNALARIHSRPVLLKRLGSTNADNIFSPARITPSNFFRATSGPEYTDIKGSEFIIPLDTMLGEFAQEINLSAVPTTGTYTITIGTVTTASLNFDASAATVQTALRLLTGLSKAVVTGSHTSQKFVIKFSGFNTAPELGSLTPTSMDATATFTNTNIPWDNPIKKGDRIIDGNKIWTMDEPLDVHELGAKVIGYRVRVDIT